MSRELAYKLIKNFDKRKSLSQTDYETAVKNVKPHDVKLLKKIVFGTIRNLTKIDYINKKLVKNYNKIPPASKAALRIGVYQLLEGFEEHAAIYETVEILKDKKMKNFVNAVLRNFLRNKDSFNFSKEHINYSYPEEKYKYIKQNFPFYKKILEKHLQPSPVVLRVNTLKIGSEDLFNKLKEKGWDIKKSIRFSDSIILNSSEIAPEKDELYLKGFYYIQNESSQLISRILNPEKGQKIYDVCSAPGGKTTHIAQLMNNEGLIIATDTDILRLETVEKNAERLGIKIIETILKKGEDYYSEAKYDKILIDAPCTSLGTSSIHPEVVHRVDLKDFKEYALIQRNILENCMKLLKSDGELVYSTCTYSLEENTQNMKHMKEKYNINFIKLTDKLNDFKINYYYDGFGYYIIPDETAIPFYMAKFKNSEEF